MSGFSADWLRQREPFDLAARSEALAFQFRAALSQGARSGPFRIFDLAAGSGSNFRALAPLLTADQEWHLIDHDPLLLTAQRAEIAQWATGHGWPCQDQEGALLISAGGARWLVRGQQLDLAHSLEALDLSSCDGLVTTAFLDLVSSAWLDRLGDLLARTPRPFLATLTVDGRRSWQPAHAADGDVSAVFLAHQQGDKGFGPSLGVAATAYLAAILAKAGVQINTEQSDWVIAGTQGDMLRNLVTEAAWVAADTAPSLRPIWDPWLTSRTTEIQQDQLTMMVGHLDLLAVAKTRL